MYESKSQIFDHWQRRKTRGDAALYSRVMNSCPVLKGDEF